MSRWMHEEPNARSTEGKTTRIMKYEPINE